MYLVFFGFVLGKIFLAEFIVLPSIRKEKNRDTRTILIICISIYCCWVRALIWYPYHNKFELFEFMVLHSMFEQYFFLTCFADNYISYRAFALILVLMLFIMKSIT